MAIVQPIYQRLAEILWSRYGVWGLVATLGGWVVINFLSFLFLPFAQDLHFFWKVAYGLGLIGVALALSVILFRLGPFVYRAVRALFRAQKTRPASQSQHAEGEGNVQEQVAGDKVTASSSSYAIKTGDDSPVTITETRPAKPQPLTPTFSGLVRGNVIILQVTNTDSEAHQFRVRLHSVTGLTEDSPKLPKWLPWWASEWELVGGKQSGEFQLAQATGYTTAPPMPRRDISFRAVGQTPAMLRRFHGYVPFGGQLEFDLEIQADAEMTSSGRSMWVLTVNNTGTPVDFRQKP